MQKITPLIILIEVIDANIFRFNRALENLGIQLFQYLMHSLADQLVLNVN